jgi:hypothetical protein
MVGREHTERTTIIGAPSRRRTLGGRSSLRLPGGTAGRNALCCSAMTSRQMLPDALYELVEGDHSRCPTGPYAAALVHDAQGLGGTPRYCLAGDLEGLAVLEVVLQQVRLAVGSDFESFGIDGLADSYPGARGAIYDDSHFVYPVSSP